MDYRRFRWELGDVVVESTPNENSKEVRKVEESKLTTSEDVSEDISLSMMFPREVPTKGGK